jgi:hypothetical protein
MITTISWEQALAELRRFVPTVSFFLSVDRVSAAAEVIAGPTDWHRFPGWENLPDTEILQTILANRPPPAGRLVVATMHMGFRGSPIECLAEDLCELVTGHLKSAGVCFFDGDVVILEVDARALTIFHHEGYFAHWRFGEA